MSNNNTAINQRQWLKDVEDLQLQNNQMKEGLAWILQRDLGPSMLCSLESFQTQLLDKDAALALLRKDIIMLDEETSNAVADTPSRLLNLGQDILKMEGDVTRMKLQLECLQNDASNEELALA